MRILGARVSVHASVFIVVGLLSLWAFRSLIEALVLVACYLVVIATHELGHALAARQRGLEVEEIRIGLFHGSCSYEATDNALDTALVALGGSALQLVLAAIVWAVMWMWPWPTFGHFGVAATVLGLHNPLVALINLTPSMELDGDTALKSLRLWWQQRRVVRDVKASLKRARESERRQ